MRRARGVAHAAGRRHRHRRARRVGRQAAARAAAPATRDVARPVRRPAGVAARRLRARVPYPRRVVQVGPAQRVDRAAVLREERL
eukprot:226282-Prymnesium_polylepis.1